MFNIQPNTLYFVSLIYFFWAATAFDIFGHTTMYLEYHTVVVLCYFFLFWREIVFSVTYVLSVQYSCAVVSVFLSWRESFITTGKKILVVCLAGCAVVSVFGSGGK